MAALDASAERFAIAYPQYERKIRTYARTHFRKLPGYGQEDLEIELQEVLWLTCRTYDPDNGASFNTLFWQITKNRFLDIRKYLFRQKRLADAHATSLDVDAVRLAVEHMTQRGSSEEEILARITVSERFRSGQKMR